jgi:hypothetical protein
MCAEASTVLRAVAAVFSFKYWYANRFISLTYATVAVSSVEELTD